MLCLIFEKIFNLLLMFADLLLANNFFLFCQKSALTLPGNGPSLNVSKRFEYTIEQQKLFAFPFLKIDPFYEPLGPHHGCQLHGIKMTTQCLQILLHSSTSAGVVLGSRLEHSK
jgi:hypothetical protein